MRRNPQISPSPPALKSPRSPPAFYRPIHPPPPLFSPQPFFSPLPLFSHQSALCSHQSTLPLEPTQPPSRLKPSLLKSLVRFLRRRAIISLLRGICFQMLYAGLMNLAKFFAPDQSDQENQEEKENGGEGMRVGVIVIGSTESLGLIFVYQFRNFKLLIISFLGIVFAVMD